MQQHFDFSKTEKDVFLYPDAFCLLRFLEFYTVIKSTFFGKVSVVFSSMPCIMSTFVTVLPLLVQFPFTWQVVLFPDIHTFIWFNTYCLLHKILILCIGISSMQHAMSEFKTV